jgi:hypothetical protein
MSGRCIRERSKKCIGQLIVSGLLLMFTFAVNGQNPLNKNISIQANKQRLDNVLEIMSNKGNFYFSYNSNIIRRDSIVTVNFTDKTVKEILDYLFNDRYQFIESGNYIILRRKPISAATTVKQTPTEDKAYILAGYIIDETTGEKLNEASVYEPLQLSSDLSNEKGYFKLKLKSKYKTASITVSKQFYKDTTITIEPRLNQQLVIAIRPEEDFTTMVTVSPEDYFLPDSIELELPGGQKYVYTKTDSIKVQKSWIGKFFLSSRQKIQSLNLKKFFTTRNFQLSFVPGIGTQGMLSPQITNNFSINILGGYTGGVKVMELGGLFNINKKNVQYVQAAGLFNAVGGTVKGLQMAGIHNLVLDSVRGVQAAGISNFVKGKFNGVQAAGIYNHVTDSMKGLQLAGIGNFSKQKIRGWQIAGIANFSNKEIKGGQIAGIINYTKKLKGVQIGLINIADTSDGYSIGLLNFVRKGYHKLSISTNETTQLNAALKTGNHKLYSILMAGMNLDNNRKLYSFGYGIGKDSRLNKHLSIITELSTQTLYAGSWDYLNQQNKFSLNLQWQPVKGLSFYAGPSFSVFVSDQDIAIQGYQFPVPSSGYNKIDFSNRTKGWIGFTAGVNFF